MNIRNLFTILALVSVTSFAAPAMALTSPGVFQDVQSTPGSSGQNPIFDDGSDTVRGNSGELDADTARQAFESLPGVDKVYSDVESHNS